MADSWQARTTGVKPPPNLIVGARLQRKCACGSHSYGGGECAGCGQKKSALQRQPMLAADNTAPSIVAEVLRTPGRPLDAATRDDMEPRFGYDFSRVRVHDDGRAAESARAVHAQAYTVGHAMVFDSGHYAPESLEGRQLITHELAHVVQQQEAPESIASDVVITESPAREAEAEHAAQVLSRGVSPTSPLHTAKTRSGLQRQENSDGASASATVADSGTPAASASCIEAVVNEDPTTLTEAGTVTIVEFGAEWCNPCKMLQASLEEMCQAFKVQPPKAPVRIFSIDIDAEGNEEIAKRYTDNNVPHIYFYVGGQQKAHYAEALQPDVLEALISEYTDEAAQSGAWKGFKSGAKWGGLIGAGLGVLGAIGIGQWGNLEGNALLAALGGSVLGGVAAGALLGGGAGALIGAATEEKKGSRRKKKRLQAKRRTGVTHDPEELEADAMAAQVARPSSELEAQPEARSAPRLSGAPMQTSLRLEMESHFGRDFSHVRLHRDPAASRITESMQAYAVTDGPDIYFAADSYAPDTLAGRAIIAHELAHVAQQDVTGSRAPAVALESEAAHASANVLRSRSVRVQQGAGRTPLPITRGQKTALGLTLGALAGAGVGALVGLGVAAVTGSSLGSGAGIGAAIGGGVGLIAGGIFGYVSRRTSRVGAQEADALIRRRYGRYLPGGVPAPLRNAVVRPVSSTELCERVRCRRPDADCNLIGWTDTGVPWRAAQPPIQTIASQADEPICNGKQMEHATPERPVIYFQNDTDDAGILVHEGLHAMAHPEFQRLHNYVNEGATEWFTRQLLADVNIAPHEGYDEKVRDVGRFIAVVGEEAFARAYFNGDLEGLDRATTAILGPCALMEWALALQLKNFDSQKPDRIIKGRHVNYCRGAADRGPDTVPSRPGRGETEIGETGGQHV